MKFSSLKFSEKYENLFDAFCVAVILIGATIWWKGAAEEVMGDIVFRHFSVVAMIITSAAASVMTLYFALQAFLPKVLEQIIEKDLEFWQLTVSVVLLVGFELGMMVWLHQASGWGFASRTAAACIMAAFIPLTIMRYVRLANRRSVRA